MYLMHHGVKGQQWGVKNGPPYPLGTSNKKKTKLQTDLNKAVSNYFDAKISLNLYNNVYDTDRKGTYNMDKETLDDYNRCLKAVTKTGVSKILDAYTAIAKNGYDLECSYMLDVGKKFIDQNKLKAMDEIDSIFDKYGETHTYTDIEKMVNPIKDKYGITRYDEALRRLNTKTFTVVPGDGSDKLNLYIKNPDTGKRRLDEQFDRSRNYNLDDYGDYLNFLDIFNA